MADDYITNMYERYEQYVAEYGNRHGFEDGYSFSSANNRVKRNIQRQKTEIEALNNKVKELDEKELENIAGGMISFEPLYELLHKNNITKNQLLKDDVLTPAHLTRLTTHHNFLEDFCKKHNIDLEELLEYIKNKTNEQ